MYLVSTGKKTVLSDFKDLETKSVYEHANGETSDFQFYEQKRIFVQVNKKSGLEIMRVKDKPNEKMELQRVRKLNIENVYCVGCAKKSLEEMALGLSNGQVKLYNYKNAEFVHRFKADSTRNSVLYLDYNASDEYVASVFESGLINIYGIKTKTKIETVNIDNSSTLARFHPTKRLQLSIASYKGGVTIYDIQSKRKVFHYSDAHMSPCRDMCMCAAIPDTLITVGFDCVINIFDTRSKTQAQQLTYCHPLSSVAISECGNYFCVGNLKGELSTFDRRNTEVCLNTKRVHDCSVTRIAFVPHEDDISCSSFGSSSNQSLSASTNEANGSGSAGNVKLRKSIATTTKRGKRDSFCDFLDFQANRGVEKMSSRFGTHRDSFDWDALCRSQRTDEQRASLLHADHHSGVASSAGDSFEAKFNSPDCIKAKAHGVAPLRDRNSRPSIGLSEKLVQIQEERSTTPPLGNSSSSDKENPAIDLELSNRLNTLHAQVNSSTPNRVSTGDTNANGNKLVHNVKTNAISKPITLSANSAAAAGADADAMLHSSEIVRELATLRNEMNERFQRLESEINFVADKNKWHIYTQSFNLWRQQLDKTDEIRDALNILLQTDPFVNEFSRLRKENEMLKLQIQKMLRK